MCTSHGLVPMCGLHLLQLCSSWREAILVPKKLEGVKESAQSYTARRRQSEDLN